MNKSVLLALAAFGSTAVAQQAPAHIDVSGLGGDHKASEMIDQVVVPVPSEIFAVLDKQGKQPWANVLNSLKKPVTTKGNPAQISLLLGTIIAEGFVAVEATNAEEVKNIGRSVLSLSAAIGVRQAVVRRSNAIIDAADKSDWNGPQGVRKQLELALTDVKKAMGEIKGEDLAQLVSLGGWLRGTEALTMVVEKNYTKEGAELLHQPMLLNYFKQRLDSLDPAKKKDPLIAKVRQGLNDIEPLMAGDGDVSEKSVKEIRDIASDLIKAINQKPTP